MADNQDLIDALRNKLGGMPDPQEGLKSYLPQQPPWLRSAQQYAGAGLSMLPPEAMLALGFITRRPLPGNRLAAPAPSAAPMERPPLSQELIQALKEEGFDTTRKYYHGSVSPKPFDKYDLGQVGSANDGGMMGEGVYLTRDLNTAQAHTLNHPLYRQRTNYKADRPRLPDEIGHVTENYIRGKVFDIDPKDVQGTVSRIREIYPDFRQDFLATTAEQAKPFSEAMQRAGYSHINDPGHALITLNPNDIRIVGRLSRDGTPWP